MAVEVVPQNRFRRNGRHLCDGELSDTAGQAHEETADPLDAGHRHDVLDSDLLGGEPRDDRSFVVLRPEPRLRFWQLIPIVALGALGSLMFSFPLAFEFGDDGPVVAMLGLLLSCCSAGWTAVTGRRASYTWPGLSMHGSDDRPNRRFVAAYTGFAVLIALLAVWRVARLR